MKGGVQMEEYVLSVSSFPQKFKRVMDELAKGNRVKLTHEKHTVGEFILPRDLRRDSPEKDDNTLHNTSETPKIHDKIVEKPTIKTDKNPPPNYTTGEDFDPNGDPEDFPWNKNHEQLMEEVREREAMARKRDAN
jgi:hypothetical protein